MTVMFFPGIERERARAGSRCPGCSCALPPARRARRSALVPVLQPHDDLDPLLQPHRADSEQRLDIDDAHTADLHVEPEHGVAAADQDPAGAPRDVHLIVGDQAMTSLDEIQHAFGLANPAAPHEKEPDSVDVRQRAVQERRWRELRLQEGLDRAVELTGLESRRDDGNTALVGLLDHPRGGLESLVMKTTGMSKERKRSTASRLRPGESDSR